MSDTFSLQTLSNGLVAVGAGLVVNTAAEMHGFLGHFVVAIIPLSLVAITVFYSWQENFGSQSNDMMNSLSRGFDLIRKDSRIAALGIVQSCFEGAMYTLVFMWTPVMKTAEETAAE